MPDFNYIARTLAGERVEGILTAGTQREAVASLSARELFPLKVDQAAAPRNVLGTRKVKAKHVAPFYGQLASLLAGGVPLLRSLTVLKEQTSNPALAEVLGDVKDRVEDGATLAEALQRHPKAFGELATSIVRAGSEGGFLEDALDRIATFTEQQDELRGKVMGALAYPMIISIIGILVVNGLIIFAVPMVEDVFQRMRDNGQLPWITEVLLALSAFMQSYWWIALAAVIGAYYGIRSWIETESGREVIDAWRLKLPGVGRIYLDLAVARFVRVLGTLLKGGVPIVKSLEIAADSTGNRVLQRTIKDASESISSGEPLASPLSESGHFPVDVVEMIAVAEQANSLETVLPKIADSLERSTWRKLEIFVRLLEPMLLLLLAGLVLCVVIALLLPIIKMSSGGM